MKDVPVITKVDFLENTQKRNTAWSTQSWYSHLKPFFLEDKNLLILHSQQHGYWYPGELDTGSQGISKHSIYIFLQEYCVIKTMCVASLTPIFTRSVGILQPMRPLGRVGSKFNWPSEDQCQRSHSKWVLFYPTLRMQTQPLNSLKTVSKVGDLSSTSAMTAHWTLDDLIG